MGYEFCTVSLADFRFLVSIFRMDGNQAASKKLKLLIMHQWR